MEGFSKFAGVLFYASVIRLSLLLLELSKNRAMLRVAALLDSLTCIFLLAMGVWNAALLFRSSAVPPRSLHLAQTFFLLSCLMLLLSLSCIVCEVVRRIQKRRNRTHLLKEEDPYFYN